MIRTLSLLALATLAACSSRAEDLERQYREVEETGIASPEELCRRAMDVAEAHLEAGNDERYRDWNLGAKVICQNAELERQVLG